MEPRQQFAGQPMDQKPNRPPDPAFDPFDFVLNRSFAHPEIACELSEESKRAREAYEKRLRQRFVKFPYLTGMKVARDCHCLVLAVLLELMWESFSHKNKNPVIYSTSGSVVSRRSKWRILQQLKQIGVIKIISRKGKNPLVHLNRLPEK